MTTARHAFTAVDATGAVWPFTSEERVLDSLTCLAEVDTDRRQPEGVGLSSALSQARKSVVARAEERIRDNAEHPLGLGEIWVQEFLPVSDARPRSGIEEGRRWSIQGVGINQRTAPDARTRHHHHIAQKVDALNTL